MRHLFGGAPLRLRGIGGCNGRQLRLVDGRQASDDLGLLLRLLPLRQLPLREQEAARDLKGAEPRGALPGAHKHRREAQRREPPQAISHR